MVDQRVLQPSGSNEPAAAARSSAYNRRIRLGLVLAKQIDPGAGADIDLVAQLLHDALTLLDQDQAMARQRIEHAFAIFMHRNEEKVPRRRGVLADWQIRRVVTYIEDNLSASLRIADVAKEIGLSASYFSRSFKASLGASYTKFLLQARLRLAKHLLLTTQVPAAEIAVMCGLADQSHLTRVFSQLVGLPPCAWRRQYRQPVQMRSDEASDMMTGLDGSGASPRILEIER